MKTIKLICIDKDTAVFSLTNAILSKIILKESQDNDTIYILDSAPGLQTSKIANGSTDEKIREFIQERPYFVVSETDPEMVLEVHKDLYNHLNDLLKPFSFKINDTNKDEYIPIFYYENENTLEAAIIHTV